MVKFTFGSCLVCTKISTKIGLMTVTSMYYFYTYPNIVCVLELQVVLITNLLLLFHKCLSNPRLAHITLSYCFLLYTVLVCLETFHILKIL